MRRSGWKVFAVAIGLATLVGALACAGLLWGSIHWATRSMDTGTAVRGRMELGLVLSGLTSRSSLLLAGDSRIEMLGNELPESADLLRVNTGLSGSLAVQWQQMLRNRLSEGWLGLGRPGARRYDVALLWVGINDFLQTDASASVVGLRVVDLALDLRRFARRVLVLEQIPVRLPSEPRSRDVGARSVEVNRYVRERLVRHTDVTVIAVHDELGAADGLLEKRFSEDGLHLNAAGNAWLGRRIAEVMR